MKDHALASARLPFVSNSGQITGEVAFYAQTFAGRVLVTRKGEVVYVLPRSESDGPNSLTRSGYDPSPAPCQGVALVERFLGASDSEPKGEEPSSALVTVFKGTDPAKWRSKQPTFWTVSLGEVWPGIEVKLHARGEDVEKVFLLASGTDPKAIRIELQGAERVALTDAGALAVRTERGEVRFSSPLAFQETPSGRRDVEVAWRVLGAHSYGFVVRGHDPRWPLVIDPVLASTFLGGGSFDRALALATDGSGNVLVAGRTLSLDFPTTAGAFDTSFDGGDAFVSRFDPALTTLQASTVVGGNGYDYAQSLAIDSSGAVVVTGFTDSTDYPTTSGALNRTFSGASGYDVFVVRLNGGLDSLLGSTYFGGTGNDAAMALALDASGDVVVAGYSGSSNFPTTVGAFDTSFNGIEDVFVARMNSGLTTLQASTLVGGSERDWAFSLAVDVSGAIILTGFTESSNFPATMGAFDTTHNGSSDVFVVRLDSSLKNLQASTFLGGNGYDAAQGLALDLSGNVLLAGSTASPNFPRTVGAFDPSFEGGDDAFVARLDPTLADLQAATILGGKSGDDYARAVTVDGSGAILVTGDTDSSDFPTTTAAFDTTFNGARDVFVSRLDSTLTSLLASTFLGGTGTEFALDMLLDGSGSVIVTGHTDSSDFPSTAETFDRSHNGGFDAYLASLDSMLSSASTFTVTVGVSEHGSVVSTPPGILCPGDCSQSWPGGTIVQLEAAPEAGWVLAGWSGDCASCGRHPSCTVTVLANQTCVASFSRVEPIPAFTLGGLGLLAGLLGLTGVKAIAGRCHVRHSGRS
ncbi:MAG TPA: SBBP repeat-containing protein [Thermoanaerobaculaceae bacterium]|nr:SBBP repeat-containing protein [Thermoanaerobaculaceae bacterium]HPS78694.1 SBBP repeat-containing protein [Thermoanaerobaculaceae bacterium]